MSLRHVILCALLLGCGAAYADDDDLPSASDLADSTAKRFPQPVRVGDLLGRKVLAPMESQPTLGWVHTLVKEKDGTVDVVMDYGGYFGFFTHPIAVPVNAMVLLGRYMEVIDYEPEQLAQFPKFNPAGTTPLPPDSVIRVGLGKPAH